MFDYILTPGQKMMVDSARELTRKVVITPQVDMALDRSGAFPHEVYKAYWENDMANIEFPESLGGAGLSCLDHVLIKEEMYYGYLSIEMSVMANSLASRVHPPTHEYELDVNIEEIKYT